MSKFRHAASSPSGGMVTPSRPPAAILAEMVGAVVLERALGEGEASRAVLDDVVGDLAGAERHG